MRFIGSTEHKTASDDNCCKLIGNRVYCMYALNVHAVPGCAYGNECMMLTRVRGWKGGERDGGDVIDDM